MKMTKQQRGTLRQNANSPFYAPWCIIELLDDIETAERERDRWKAVHDRNWRVYQNNVGGWEVYIPTSYSAYGLTPKAALEAAFVLFPLDSK